MRTESASDFRRAPDETTSGDDRPPGGISTLEWRLLRALAVPERTIRAVAAGLAPDHLAETGIAPHLIAAGLLDAAQWWPGLAAPLGLAVADRLEAAAPDDPRLAARAALDRRLDQIWIAGRDGPILAIAPMGETIPRVAGFLASHPILRQRMVVAAPEAIRAALNAALARSMTEAARTGLLRRFPDFSAAVSPNPVGVVLLVVAMVVAPVAILWATPVVDLAFLGLFLAHALLRLMAALDPVVRAPAPALPEEDLPTYAVLVPLYRETDGVIAALAEAIRAIDYPRDRLDLKLLVEADDVPTLASARAWAAPAGWDVVAVTPSLPRTKPKALAIGLQLVDAEIVAVFDAEDRPAPDQLRRAAAALAAGGARLACVQAELAIDHTRHRPPWIAAQFALEYAMLFQRLLPWLSERTGWFLLGGTSNHFRRDALEQVGGWDPYNVTEDADIALRLLRAGYRLDVFASVTGEEAPVSLRVWQAQRSRWLKGWMQTWAVHMRAPRRLLADLGIVGFLQVQVLLGGQILAALAFPASIIAVALAVSGVRPILQDRPFLDDMALAAALLTFLLAWGGAGWLALRSRPALGPVARLWCILTLPAYWLLLFPAVLRAGIGLARAPSDWAKTPHGLAARTPPRRNLPLARRLWLRLSRRR